MNSPAQRAQATSDRRTRSAFRGCLLGGAIGDALGAPVEFMKLAEIRRTFGRAGVTDFAPAYGRLGAITDDTQMTLFTAEGLVRAHNRWLGRGIVSVEAVVRGAYERWLSTQRPSHRDGEPDQSAGWLIGVRELQAARAPGNTCISALEDGAPVEDSKGCGGVMRIAPVGLVAEAPFALGCELAGLTHGHPTGRLAAGALAEIIRRLLDGATLLEAAGRTLASVEQEPDHQETSAAIRAALALARRGTPTPEQLETLGGGWVAEGALAIGLCCALVARDFRHGVLLAVNHSGDSDSTGSIAGNLLGLLHGEEGLPLTWREQVELNKVVMIVADDLLATLATGANGSEPYCVERYPGV